MLNRLRLSKKARNDLQKNIIINPGEKVIWRDKDGFPIAEIDDKGNLRVRGGKVGKV